MKLKDFGFGSCILSTQQRQAGSPCAYITSTKNQCSKSAVVKINTAKLTNRFWDWQRKGLKLPGDFESNISEPAEDSIRFAFVCSQRRRNILLQTK